MAIRKAIMMAALVVTAGYSIGQENVTSTKSKIDTKPASKISLAQIIRSQPKFVYADGLLRAATTVWGTSKYTYENGKISTKTNPDGTLLTYSYDRLGKLDEIRFSTGLVRRAQYDENGKLSAIAGSDGYTLVYGGTGPADVTLTVTGPENYRRDLTSLARTQTVQSSLQTKATVEEGTLPSADLIDFGGFAYAADCGGEWGGGGGGGDWGGGNWGGGGGYIPDLTFQRCMVNICDPADLTFRRYCNVQPTPQERYECNTVAARDYWACEASCR